MMVAMHDGTNLVYFAQDHLSSTSIVMNDTGGLLSQNRYMPFGEVRDISGVTNITQTDFGYTGQRNIADIGLMDYDARFYSPTLMRFIQPDTVIPNPSNPQSYNRYSYVVNNPLLYIDPTGHFLDAIVDLAFIVYDVAMIVRDQVVEGEVSAVNTSALAVDVVMLFVPFGTGGGLVVRAGEAAVVKIGAKEAVQLTTKAIQFGYNLSEASDDIGGSGGEESAKEDLNSSDESGPESGRSVEDILEESTQSQPNVYNTKGTEADALSDYNYNVNPRTDKPHPKIDGGRLGSYNKGGTIGYRPESKSGPPTLDLNHVNLPGYPSKFKIKYLIK